MPLKRTPPKNSPSQQASNDGRVDNYGSDSELTTGSKSDWKRHEDAITPPKHVYMRNKRAREPDVSPGQLSSFKDKIKNLFATFMSEQNRKLTGITTNLQEIKETNENIVKSILLLTSQNDELCKKIEMLESQSTKDREYIVILEEKVEDLQRISRKSSLELKNVPRKPQESREDLIKMVKCLSKTVNLNLSEHDIADVYRLKRGINPENTPTIVLELSSTLTKTDLLKKTKDFTQKTKTRLRGKHMGLTINEETPIFVSERLTPKAARLFFLARDLVRSKEYKYCWTTFGKVFLRKDDTSKVIQILNEAQVHQLKQIK